jgi:hypothetical protein
MAPRAASGGVEPQDHPKQGHRISKFFVVNYMSNTPIGSLDVNISKLLKLKATWLSPENQVTLGGYFRGHPPPRKNGPIFRKFANYAST